MEQQEKFSVLKDVFMKSKKVFMYLILIAFGYALCEISNHVKYNKEKVQRTKSIQETSVAINERGELILMDRATGDYMIYQDSIGKSIFNLYAVSMESTYKESSSYKDKKEKNH